MDMAGAAMMGLGAVNAGVQLYGQHVQARQQKKQDALMKGAARRRAAFDLKNMEEGQKDAVRGLYRQGQELQGQALQEAPGQGRADSSWHRDDVGDFEYGKKQRLSSIQRAIDEQKAGGNDREKAWRIQRKMDRTAKTMGMISNMLLQGASGVGASQGISSLG